MTNSRINWVTTAFTYLVAMGLVEPIVIAVAMSFTTTDSLRFPPVVVPIVVLGAVYFFVWANGWSIGSFTIGGKMLGTVSGLVLAHTIIAIPYPFVTVRANLVNVDQTLELAAKNLGANPVRAFTTITLPLILPGVFSGFIFAFIASWDEVVLASFLSTSRLSTVPVQIFQQLRDALDPSAAAISSLLLLGSIRLVGSLLPRH